MKYRVWIHVELETGDPETYHEEPVEFSATHETADWAEAQAFAQLLHAAGQSISTAVLREHTEAIRKGADK